ncbi:MAG: hypothetical protein H3Z54_11705 [archaeon]|nr:hypothetical protein [archaeon]
MSAAIILAVDISIFFLGYQFYSNFIVNRILLLSLLGKDEPKKLLFSILGLIINDCFRLHKRFIIKYQRYVPR